MIGVLSVTRISDVSDRKINSNWLKQNKWECIGSRSLKFKVLQVQWDPSFQMMSSRCDIYISDPGTCFPLIWLHSATGSLLKV